MTIIVSAADIALLQAGKPVTLQSQTAPTTPTDPPPVDPRAKLLSFLQGLPEAKLKKFLSGEHADYGFTGSPGLANWNALVAKTGKTPAIMGLVLDTIQIMGGSDGSLSPQQNAQFFAQHTGAGGIVQLNWFMPNPVANAAADTSLSDSDFKSVITPGTAAYNEFQTIIKSAIATLKSAPYNGVPCLFRPLIEIQAGPGPASGVNWYSHQQIFPNGTANFTALYQMIHNAFTAAGINWLVWIWNPNNWPEMTDTDLWNGLDSMVDLVGSDIYPNPFDTKDITGSINFTWQTLVKKGKPIFLPECGYRCPDQHGNPTGDNQVWLNTLKADYPSLIGSVYWAEGNDCIADLANAQSFMTDPYVITLSDLPSFK